MLIFARSQKNTSVCRLDLYASYVFASEFSNQSELCPGMLMILALLLWHNQTQDFMIIKYCMLKLHPIT